MVIKMKSREELLQGYDEKYALFGVFFAFGNQLQTAGDSFYEEITSKQFFFLICLNLFREDNPTINELSEVMCCSHQNVKQLALKLEKLGLIQILTDSEDKRKLRVKGTPQIAQLSKKYGESEMAFMKHFFEGISDEEIATTYRVMCKLENNLKKIKKQCEK